MRILLKAFGKLTLVQSITREAWLSRRRIYMLSHFKPPTQMMYENISPVADAPKRAVFEHFGHRTANGMPIYEFVDLV